MIVSSYNTYGEQVARFLAMPPGAKRDRAARHLIVSLENRVADSAAIPWPALEAAFRRELDLVKAALGKS